MFLQRDHRNIMSRSLYRIIFIFYVKIMLQYSKISMTNTRCRCKIYSLRFVSLHINATQLQAWTGPERSRRLRLPDFKTIGT